MSPTQPEQATPERSDLDAEESLLGAMLLSPTAIDVAMDEGVAAADFYRYSHGAVFIAALALYGEGQPVDAITVADRLDEQGKLADAGGRERLKEIAMLVPAVSSSRRYAQIVRENAILRGLAVAGLQIHRDAVERNGTGREILERAEGRVFDLSTSRGHDFVTARVAVGEAYERLRERHENRRGQLVGVPSGFRRVDDLTSGFQQGNLVIVGARPSVGKTAYGLSIAANVAVRAELPTALFTMEMSRTEIGDRLLSAEALVESQKIRTGSLDSEEWRRVTEAATRLDRAPLLIDDTASLTAMELRSKARRMKMLHPNLALVIVDYLQLMTSGQRAENRTQDVSQTSRMMKVLARELAVPVVALSQLSRQVEQRHDKRPMLSDLRESGGIEADADVVMFLYRDEYYNPEDTDQEGIAEVNIAKHRSGPTGTVKLAFVKRYVRFSELAPGE